MKRIFIPTNSGSDWQRLLAKPTLHWKMGASAMTAAASWETAGNVFPPEITALFNASNQEELRDLELLAAIPEWEVPLEGGETTSHNDILAIGTNAIGLCVMAVEAKVNEDFGPLLKAKRAVESEGFKARLKYLHDLLCVEHFDDLIRYQLLHRTASALLAARDFHAKSGVMLVHSFVNLPALRDDFEAFCRALCARHLGEGLYVVTTPSEPKLFLAWCNGDTRFLNVNLPSIPKSV